MLLVRDRVLRSLKDILTINSLKSQIASKIRDAYVFLAQNFDKGDDICLFG